VLHWKPVDNTTKHTEDITPVISVSLKQILGVVIVHIWIVPRKPGGVCTQDQDEKGMWTSM